MHDTNSTHAEGDKQVAPLIPDAYLLKTIYKEEKQHCHSHTIVPIPFCSN